MAVHSLSMARTASIAALLPRFDCNGHNTEGRCERRSRCCCARHTFASELLLSSHRNTQTPKCCTRAFFGHACQYNRKLRIGNCLARENNTDPPRGVHALLFRPSRTRTCAIWMQKPEHNSTQVVDNTTMGSRSPRETVISGLTPRRVPPQPHLHLRQSLVGALEQGQNRLKPWRSGGMSEEQILTRLLYHRSAKLSPKTNLLLGHSRWPRGAAAWTARGSGGRVTVCLWVHPRVLTVTTRSSTRFFTPCRHGSAWGWQ